MIVTPNVDEGVAAFLEMECALLSVINMDDAGYTIRFRTVNLIII
jgi:hypothetical protein